MKHNFRTLTLLCTVGAMFTACSNELEPAVSTGPVKVTAIATMGGSDDTRLTFQEDNTAHKLRLAWKESGEQFLVFSPWGSQFEFTQTGSNNYNNREATFTSSMTANPGETCHALYPIPESRSWSEITNLCLSVTNQKGLQYDDNRALMYARTTYVNEAAPLELEFKHLTSALKATIQFPEGITGLASNVALIADAGLMTDCRIDFTQEVPTRVTQWDRFGAIKFTSNFPIKEGKITVYANIFPNTIKNLRLAATVDGKQYFAILMAEKTLEAGKWYYPASEAKMATQLDGFSVDKDTHTINITVPGALSVYNGDVSNLLEPVIDAATGTLKVTGTPSGSDVKQIGQSVFNLANGSGSKLLKLDMSGVSNPNLTILPDGAMSNANSLEEIILPNSITYLEIGSLIYCSALKRINVENITAVDNIPVFEGSKNLGTLDFQALTEVGSMPFVNMGFVNFNAPVLKTLAGSGWDGAFNNAIVTGTINLPQCTYIGVCTFAVNTNNGQEFTLKLTSAEEIIMMGNVFGYEGVEHQINLVLNPNKQSEVINGNEWKGYTFKSITFEEPKSTI